MSPSEFDLRAALHEGEGDEVDAGAIIADGQARLAQRRVRIRSAAAVGALVAVVGVGGTLLFRAGGSGSGSSVGSQADNGPAAGAQAPARPTPSVPGQHAASTATTGCPKTFPRYLLPGGGSPGQFGSGRPLFDKPVSSVLVCSYGPALQQKVDSTGTPAGVRLTGAQAAAVVRSLEQASKIQSKANCPLLENTGPTDVAMIGLGADGRKVATVTATLSTPPCNVEVTNGTAVRYDWQPPAPLLLAVGDVSAPSGGSIAHPTPTSS